MVLAIVQHSVLVLIRDLQIWRRGPTIHWAVISTPKPYIMLYMRFLLFKKKKKVKLIGEESKFSRTLK